MNESEKEKRLNFLCNQLADCRDINLTDKTIELIEEVIQITNDDFIEKYDCFVGKDHDYWGIDDGWDVNYKIALYYNNEANPLFKGKSYKKAMMFLHFADYHASKNHYSIKSDYYDLIFKCNKGFCLLKMGDISAASICFSNIINRYDYMIKHDLHYEFDLPQYSIKPQEYTLLGISMSLGMAITYLKLGKIQEAEKLLIKISTETQFSQDDAFYDNFIFKSFATKTAFAEMYHRMGDDQKALKTITDAVSNLHCHNYIADSATYMLDLVKKHLEEQEKPNLDELLSLMYDAHIHRDSLFIPSNVDRLFV